jgi:hypothetical protein
MSIADGPSSLSQIRVLARELAELHFIKNQVRRERKNRGAARVNAWNRFPLAPF